VYRVLLLIFTDLDFFFRNMYEHLETSMVLLLLLIFLLMHVFFKINTEESIYGEKKTFKI